MKKDYYAIRKATYSDIKQIKKLVDSTKEMDIIKETFSEGYYKRKIEEGTLLVATLNNKIIGICFGTYNATEKWADLLGLIVSKKFRKKGIGKKLVEEFEKIAKKKKLKTIDLYADRTQLKLFKKLGYKQGRTYTAFRKKFKI